MTFAQAISNGYVDRMVNHPYRAYVKSLPCCACQAPSDDPHHLYSRFSKGMGTKVPDYWCIPLCRPCHDTLHGDVTAWEEANGAQWQHVVMTMTQAVVDGVLRA